jgi:hypothetical protein
MMRKAAFFVFSALMCLQLNAQITITNSDMPVPGDTVRKSLTTVLDGFDYQAAGPNRTWVFDELTVISQQVDTFMSVSETPAIYQFMFNNNWIYPDYVATAAQKMATFNMIPGLSVSDSYLFVKNEDDEYREVGYGTAIAGVQIPIQLQQIDTIYRFPLQYGDIDSAHSLLEIDVPDLGYLLVSKFRRNTADGWGTLTTPYGEFQTLRIKTEIHEYDSLYSDSLGIGIPVTRNIIEYKWLANGYPEPMLLVSEEALLVTATYIDSVRSTFLSVPEARKNKVDFSVYPNPCNDYLTLSYELDQDAEVQVVIYSVYGSELKRIPLGRQERGYFNRILYLKELGIREGMYFVSLAINDEPLIRKVIVK